jgi:hypothetical protein
MKRVVSLVIDCNAETCGRCDWASPVMAGSCFLWNQSNTGGRRIAECLAAEETKTSAPARKRRKR